MEMVKEPLKRELRRAAMEMQELIKWNEILERQRDEAKRQLPPLEAETERLQNTLDGEVQHHLQTRDELRMLKDTYHKEIQQWKDQLDVERKSRNKSMKQLDSEIADLKVRRARAEELMEDQKKSLEWKDEVINKYKRELSVVEQKADKFERQAESLQRQLTHSLEEREREKEVAEAKLQSTIDMLTEQHQLVVDSMNEARAREQVRHARELADKDVELEDQRVRHAAAMKAQKEEIEALMQELIDEEKAKTAVVSDALDATKRALADTKKQLAQSKQAHADEVGQLNARLAKIDKEWGFRVGEVKRELQASQIRVSKEAELSGALRSKIDTIEQNHWQYQAIDKTAGPHLARGTVRSPRYA